MDTLTCHGVWFSVMYFLKLLTTRPEETFIVIQICLNYLLYNVYIL